MILKRPVPHLLPRVIGYGPAIYLGLGLIAYGLAWRQFATTPESAVSRGGKQAIGKVLAMRSSGFGETKNYWLTISGTTEELMLPGLLANPAGIEPGYRPIVLSELVREGSSVTVQTSGSRPPVILQLVVHDAPGGAKEVLGLQVSSMRFTRAIQLAGGWGNSYILWGVLLIGGFAVAERLSRRMLRTKR